MVEEADAAARAHARRGRRDRCASRTAGGRGAGRRAARARPRRAPTRSRRGRRRSRRRSSTPRAVRAARCSTRRRRHASACSPISCAGARCCSAQIEELRGGRDRLLDAYRTVKRTFLEATEALAQVEARAAAERSTTAARTDRHRGRDRGRDRSARRGRDAGDATRASTSIDDRGRRRREVEAADAVALDADDRRRRRRARRRRLAVRADPRRPRRRRTRRRGRGRVAVRRRGRRPTSEPSDGARAGRRRRARARARPEAGRRRRVARTAGARASTRCSARWSSGPSAPRRTTRTRCSTRSAGTRAARPPTRCCPTSTRCVDDVERRCCSDAVDRAYARGPRRGRRRGRDAEPDDSCARRPRPSSSPLRERITVAIDTGDEGDTGGLVERIGARYREWKNQSLEPSLARGARVRRGRVACTTRCPTARCCGGCRSRKAGAPTATTTALEPTVKGEHFPTGQAFPPAHPGCECLLAPAVIARRPRKPQDRNAVATPAVVGDADDVASARCAFRRSRVGGARSACAAG